MLYTNARSIVVVLFTIYHIGPKVIRILQILIHRMPILLIWYHNAGLVTIRAGQGQGFSPATMSVSSGNYYRKQKENRTKRTSELYNSPATDHIYTATWSVSDSLAQWPLSYLILVNIVQSGQEMIQLEINIVFLRGEGDIFVISSTLKSLITVEPY